MYMHFIATVSIQLSGAHVYIGDMNTLQHIVSVILTLPYGRRRNKNQSTFLMQLLRRAG